MEASAEAAFCRGLHSVFRRVGSARGCEKKGGKEEEEEGGNMRLSEMLFSLTCTAVLWTCVDFLAIGLANFPMNCSSTLILAICQRWNAHMDRTDMRYTHIRTS